MQKRSFFLIFFFLVFHDAVVASDVWHSFPTLRVGLIHTFSKADPSCYDQFTNNLENAVAMAWDEYKAAHRNLKYNISFEKYDIDGNKLNAAEMMKKAHNDGCVAVIGYVCSNYALIGGREAQKLKVPLITPTATADEISQIGDYVYMSSFRDSYQGQVLAKFVVEDLNLNKAVVLKTADSVYSVSLAEAFKREYLKRGGNIVFEKSILTSDTNYDDFIKQVSGMDYQIVFIPNYALQTSGIIAAFLKHGQNKIFIGGDAWNLSENTNKIIGDAYFEGYMTMSWIPDIDTVESKKFVNNYRKRFNEEPLDVAAHSYDSAMLLFKSIEGANNFTGEAIKNSLSRTTLFNGMTGSSFYGGRTYPEKTIILIKVTGKKSEIHKIYSPDK